MEDLKEHNYPEDTNSQNHVNLEEKTETRIDNNPDNRIEKVKANLKKNPWIVVSLVLAIGFVVLLVLVLRGGVTGNVISGEDAGGALVEYLNARTGGGVEYVSFEDLGNIYQVNVKYQDQEIPVYVTKDGDYFVQGAVPMTGDVISPIDSQTQEQAPADVPKSDKPVVELFVMTECPYGTQAEKGMIPAFEALGDKIDGNIKFVHYFMHGDKEEAETYTQICIREEQSSKYMDYLVCYLEDGDSARCVTETGIDKTKLGSCVTSSAKGYYAADSSLSEGYGVQGSPTLVINGVQASSARDSASYLSVICNAFNNAPAECEQALSSAAPSPGFGYSASGGSDTNAQC